MRVFVYLFSSCTITIQLLNLCEMVATRKTYLLVAMLNKQFDKRLIFFLGSLFLLSFNPTNFKDKACMMLLFKMQAICVFNVSGQQ